MRNTTWSAAFLAMPKLVSARSRCCWAHVLLLRRRLLSHDRAVALALGGAFSTFRLPPLPAGKRNQHRERPRRRPSQGQRAALLTHLLREQVLLRHSVDGGGEIGAGFDEFRVAGIGAITQSR